MPVAETSPPTGIWHRSADAHRSLPRIAARLLYAKDKEELGLEEVDRVAVAIERAVRSRYLILATSFLLCLLLLLLVLVVWGAAALDGKDIGQGASVVAIPLLAMAACVAASWRHFQYGLGIAETKRTPVYGSSPVRPSKRSRSSSIIWVDEPHQQPIIMIGEAGGVRCIAVTFTGGCAACCCPKSPATGRSCFHHMASGSALRSSSIPNRKRSSARSKSGPTAEGDRRIMIMRQCCWP